MRRIAALLVPLALVVAGCSGSSNGSGQQAGYATGGTFTMGLSTDPGVFDPYHSQLIFGSARLAYDSLVNLLPDGKLVSGLAEKWTADARTATFTLRQGITCSDGTPLGASQVAAAISYVADPKNKSAWYGVGVPSSPMTATGDDATRTVKVTMTREPFGFLLNSVGTLPIMCAKGMKDRKLLEKGSDGSGPFVLSEVVPGQSYTFTVRKGYTWGPGGASTSAPGTPDKVVLRIVANETTAANLVLSGELNLASISGADRQRMEAQGLKKIELAASGAWLWFNQIGGRPTADKRLRQALVSTLDLDEMVKVSTGGNGGPSTGLVALDPQPCPGDTVSGKLPKHDEAAAEALLDQAGWVKGPDGIRAKDGKQLTIDLHFVPAFHHTVKPSAELVSAKWKAIGIQVKLTADTATTMNQFMFETSNYDAYLGGFGVNLPTQMVPYLSGPIPPKGVNLAGIDNPGYKSLVAKAAALTAPAACQYWNQAEEALWRNLDIAPISNRPYIYYLKNAEADGIGFNLPIPTSIRMLG